jgi:hypothetical protein
MSLRREIILGEIEGKNNAVHAYDRIIWTIRSGYLILLLGGWAIVIKGSIEKGSQVQSHLLAAMLLVSIGFALGAFILDQNYMRRKFRVIAVLNRLLSCALDVEDLESISSEDKKTLHELVRVSGDADNKEYQTDGYKQAARAEIALYSVSLMAVVVAGLIYGILK